VTRLKLQLQTELNAASTVGAIVGIGDARRAVSGALNIDVLRGIVGTAREVVGDVPVGVIEGIDHFGVEV